MPSLRYTTKTRPLLKFVSGQKRVVRKPEEDIADSKASTPSGSRGALKSDVDPVLDSESPGPRAQFQKPSDLSSDESEDDRTQRGAISRTKFGPSSTTKNSAAGSKKTSAQSVSKTSASAEGTTQRSQAKRRKLDDGLNSRDGGPKKVPNSSQQSRTSEVPSSSGEHLMGGDGFVRKHKVKTTYSKCPKASASTATKTSAERSLSGKGKQKASSRDFKQVPSTDEDDEATPRGASKFRSISNSGSKSPSPAKSKKTAFKLLKDSDVSDTEPSTGNRRKKRRNTPPEDQTPKAVFKAIPATQHFAGTDSGYMDDHDVDEPLSDIESEDENAEANQEPEYSVSRETPCPWCGEPVSKTMLNEFSKGGRMSVQQQTLFCRKHKKQAAMDSWDAKSYPNIDWAKLPNRIKTHYYFLTEIVDGKPSHFRAELAKQIEAGKARSLQKEVNLNPGYYGPRGFNLMCDILVDKFTNLLKEKAVHDKVIAGRGSAAFIQVVLLPELAVQLTMEDMGVPIEEARDIMEEGKALGEIVHEEI